MSAKRHLHLLLVASLIVFLFALVPANAEETNLKLIDIEHHNSKEENNIDIQVGNYEDADFNCNLMLTIYSIDLTENIPLDDSITFFDVGSNDVYNHSFTFTIPISGDYLFNLTLLIEENQTLSEHYINEVFTFYEYTEYQLSNIIADYYYDPSDNANWIYSSEDKTIELKNIEDSYDTGIVLGPFNTIGLASSSLTFEYESVKSLNSNYTIYSTNQFNSSEIYGTEWQLLHDVGGETSVKVEIPNESQVFILLRGQDNEPLTENYWNINKVALEKLTIKHSLSINTQTNYFFKIDEKNEISIYAKNIGTFNQQLGNVSIIAKLFNENEMINSYAVLPSIESGETQNIKINLDDNLLPGNYFIKLETTIINNNLFFDEKLILLSISNYNYGAFELNLGGETKLFTTNIQNNNIQILIYSEEISQLNFSNEFTISELTEKYYTIRAQNIEDSVNLNTDTTFIGEIISIINMDEVKYSLIDNETPITTIEGITAPSIIFDDGKEKIITVTIKNEGFYTETYDLTYIYSPTFVYEIEGLNAIEILPNNEESIEIKVRPLEKIPREGGSQFNIEVSNNNENKIFTYLFSYLEPTIEISEVACDRYALLEGQSLKCTTILTNTGYYSNDLTFLISSDEVIIEEVKIDSLDYLETWTLTTTYEPQITGETSIIVNVIGSDGEIFEKEIESKIKVVSAENGASEESDAVTVPEINIGRSAFLLTLAGVLYQIKRSENLKYLGLKFFFVPMYSRLQKDTLADEPTRQKLLKYIYAEPGANFKQLKDKFSLHNGTLAHHINILENHDIITSHRSGRQRLFFPMGINREISRVSLVTNETQRNIMEIIKKTPGITQAMISKQLGMSRQKINYHVNSLVDKAFLKIEKQGRITRLYPLYYT